MSMNQYEKTQILEDNKQEILFTLDNLLESKAGLAKRLGVSRSALYRALNRWERDYYVPHKRIGKLPYLFKGGDERELYWQGYLTQRGHMKFWEREGKYINRIVTPRLTVSGPKAEAFAEFAGISPKRPVQVTLNEDEAVAMTFLSVSDRPAMTYSKSLHFLRGIYDASEEEGVITFYNHNYWYFEKTVEYLDELGVEWVSIPGYRIELKSTDFLYE